MRVLLPLLFGALVAAGCDVERDFRVAETTAEMAVAGNPSPGALSVTTTAAGDITDDPKYRDKSVDEFESVTVVGATLTITANSTNGSIDTLEDGNPDDFNFLTAVDLYLDRAGQSVLVARLPAGDAQFSAGSTTLALQLTGADAEWVAGGAHTVRVVLSGTEPVDDVIFTATLTFDIEGWDEDD